MQHLAMLPGHHLPGPEMQLDADGFALVPKLLSETECNGVAQALSSADSRGVGSRRLLEEDWCADLAHKVMIHPEIRGSLPANARAVQCTFFEKSAEKNWLVPIHQDLSIPVARRVGHPGLSGWSEKEGAVFVQPPDTVLRQLLAVRVHIDRCSEDDGPLRLVPASHELGRVDPGRAAILGRRQGIVVPAERGDALVMRPLVLHASSKSSGTSRRRVLHFLFGPEALPFDLAW
ncbi:phytanoyl-CoA dioxygenase family protein [Pelomonas sp. APW6]|uniref:Phytanoyl-CoA dioxygenase family protein n=1 Tax=Roseateles subflavus TaxID=3053353 RepID=A0ABT7LFZ4_9BURK|nr:phytanoyl-CoA dioxygenase family protein [Pelomonas sp. APW6]MDL5031783.1 phytanoyl-CoA dioxygenase family protein [Pelomonas sp. APW6]